MKPLVCWSQQNLCVASQKWQFVNTCYSSFLQYPVSAFSCLPHSFSATPSAPPFLCPCLSPSLPPSPPLYCHLPPFLLSCLSSVPKTAKPLPQDRPWKKPSKGLTVHRHGLDPYLQWRAGHSPLPARACKQNKHLSVSWCSQQTEYMPRVRPCARHSSQTERSRSWYQPKWGHMRICKFTKLCIWGTCGEK